MVDKRKIKKDLLAALPATFCDAVTGYRPTRETEFTAILAMLDQYRAVDWKRVPLFSPTYEPSGQFADALFADGGTLLCEYPMFCGEEPRSCDMWGDMKADLLYLSPDQQTVVLVENKIGGAFTSGGSDVETGQLARQIEYLNQAQIAQPHLVLLSAEPFFEAKWYSTELAATIQHKKQCARVHAHLMKWEDILRVI